ELGLAVAGHAGDPHDLATVDRDRDVVDHGPAVGGAHGEVVDRQAELVGDRALAGLGGGQLAADHELGELAAGDLAGGAGGHGGATADHGDGVGHREDLVQLVGDEQDGDALRLEVG